MYFKNKTKQNKKQTNKQKTVFNMDVCMISYGGGGWIKIVWVQVDGSKHSEQTVLTTWGPGTRSRALGAVQGQRPGGDPGAQSPWKLLGFQGFKTQKCLLLHGFSFILRQVLLQNQLI